MSGNFERDNCYKSGNDFQFEGRYYTRDPGSGRCYLTEPSADRQGFAVTPLVRRRVPEETYTAALAALQMAIREAAAAASDPGPGLPSRRPLLRYLPGKGPLYEGSGTWR